MQRGSDGNARLLGVHKASFVVWLAATAVHVLAYIRRVPGLTVADWRAGAGGVEGSVARRAALATVVVAGAILAVATVRYASAWTHWAGVDGD